MGGEARDIVAEQEQEKRIEKRATMAELRQQRLEGRADERYKARTADERGHQARLLKSRREYGEEQAKKKAQYDIGKEAVKGSYKIQEKDREAKRKTEAAKKGKFEKMKMEIGKDVDGSPIMGDVLYNPVTGETKRPSIGAEPEEAVGKEDRLLALLRKSREGRKPEAAEDPAITPVEEAPERQLTEIDKKNIKRAIDNDPLTILGNWISKGLTHFGEGQKLAARMRDWDRLTDEQKEAAIKLASKWSAEEVEKLK
jgi:hypothetical protein